MAATVVGGARQSPSAFGWESTFDFLDFVAAWPVGQEEAVDLGCMVKVSFTRTPLGSAAEAPRIFPLAVVIGLTARAAASLLETLRHFRLPARISGLLISAFVIGLAVWQVRFTSTATFVNGLETNEVSVFAALHIALFETLVAVGSGLFLLTFYRNFSSIGAE